MISTSSLVLRLSLAALFGGVIGANRGRLEWAAGLRTHMLVCVGAALAMIVSTFGFADVLDQPHVVLDPSRIAAQVISGVGFLGAGTILFLERERVVRGLTTAAGLWAVASIGLAAGSGLYTAAAIATALLWIILAVLKPIERRFLQRRKRATGMRITLAEDGSLSRIEQVLGDLQLPWRRLALRRDVHAGRDVVVLRTAEGCTRDQLLRAAEALGHLDGVAAVDVTGQIPR